MRRAASTSGTEGRLEKGAQRRQRVLAHRHARGHGVTAALGEQTFGHGAAHRAADIDADDGAARPGADAAGFERDRERRPAEFFLEPRRHEADDAGMPALRGGDHHRPAFLEAERGHRLGFGLRHGLEFDRLPLAVEPVELRGDLCRFDRVILDEEPDPEVGAADASAGVDARAEQKAEMPGLRRTGEPRHVHQAHVPGALAPAQRDQALGDERAVEPDKRHHVGDGAERHVVDEREQIGLGAGRRSRNRASATPGSPPPRS